MASSSSSPSGEPVTSARPAGARVLASFQLFPAICAFLPGQPAWLAALERKEDPGIEELTLTLEAKKGTGAPGLFPFLAIQQRDLRALERLWVLHKQPQFRKNPKYWFQSALHDAATLGNVEALQWLFETTGESCDPASVSLAAMHGHADVVRWQLVHLPNFDLESAQRAMIKAASTGHLEVLKAFHEWRKDACTSQMMDLAAAHGHLDVVQFLHEHGDADCTTAAVDGAAENGHLEVVKWLLTNRKDGFTQAALRGAIAHGHLAVVQYMWEEHCHRDGPNENLSTFTQGMRAGVPHAIQEKNLAMLRYLHENVGEDAFPPYALSLAAESPRDTSIFHFLQSTRRPREDVNLALRRVVDSCAFVEFLLANETFSIEVLTDTLQRAMILKDKATSERNVMALQIAIAQKKQHEIDAGTNCFAPAAPSAAKTTTASTQRERRKRGKP